MSEPIKLRVIGSGEPINIEPALVPVAVEAISPHVSYEYTEDGVNVTITDVDGAHTFLVPKGDTGDPGVYVGTTEPTDPDINVWINPDSANDTLRFRTGETWRSIRTIIGPKGDKGDKGDQGERGNGIVEIYKTLDGRICIVTSDRVYYFELPQGDPGQGVPAGGTAGQVLVKTGSEDYSTEWSDGLVSLRSAFDTLAAFVDYNDIATFTLSPASVEIGNATASVALAWTFNATPTQLTLNGITKDVTSTGETVTATDDGSTHQVKYTLATAIGSKEVTFHFYPKAYYGAAEIPQSVNSAFVTGLANGVLAASRARTVTVNAGTGKYIWYAVPVRYGACSFKVGGFDGGFETAQTVSVTNASGYTENYYVYRSSNASLGSTSVVVS